MICTLTRRDLTRFLLEQHKELADWLVWFEPATAARFLEDHPDELTAFVRRWQHELEGEYDTNDTV